MIVISFNYQNSLFLISAIIINLNQESRIFAARTEANELAEDVNCTHSVVKTSSDSLRFDPQLPLARLSIP